MHIYFFLVKYINVHLRLNYNQIPIMFLQKNTVTATGMDVVGKKEKLLTAEFQI